MKNKKPAAAVFFMMVVFVFTACVSDGEGEEYLYYSPEEVMDAWISGIYDDDFDQLLSVYWTDVQGEFIPHDYDYFYVSHIDEMAEYLDEYYDDIYDRIEDESPEIFWGEETDDSYIEAYIYYEKEHLGETFILSRQGSYWAIEWQELHEFTPFPTPGPLMAWTDMNDNDLVDYQENHKITSSVHMLLNYTHEVNNGLDQAFDRNDDGYIDEEDRQTAREYFYVAVNGEILTTDRDFALEYYDLDRNGEVVDEEIETVLEYLFQLNVEWAGEYNENHPLYSFLDENKDGTLSIDEKNRLYWELLWHFSYYTHPASPLEMLTHRNENIQEDRPRENSIGGEKINGKRLAIVDIDSLTSKIDEETEKGILLFVENSFVNTGKVTVVDRQSIERIMEEHKFQASGITDEQTAVEIGKLAGAELIVLGSLTNVGSKYYLQIRLIDVKTAEVVASSLSEALGEDDFLEMSRRVVEDLF